MIEITLGACPASFGTVPSFSIMGRRHQLFPYQFPNPFPNTVRGDGVFHRLAGKFFQGGASEVAVGCEHQRYLREAPPREISQPFPPKQLEEMESFTGLQGNFSEAELPKMP
jgi:hypothetical protein